MAAVTALPPYLTRMEMHWDFSAAGVYTKRAASGVEITGTVSGHRDGFGFVARDDGEGDDVYLSAREMRSLFDGDRVAVAIKGLDRRGRAEGRLVEVLERGEDPQPFLDSLR